MPHTGVNKDKDGNRMENCKTPPTTPGEQIAQQILNNYDIKSAEDVQDVLETDFGPIFESMLKGEMENHLGHKKHERSEDGDNVRNGYSSKTLKTSLGEVPIRVPRDRQSTFEPQIIKKHQRDVSSIEGKVLVMYARGMSQRDIAATIEDIYGFQMSHEQISHHHRLRHGRGRGMAESSLQSFYPFAFVDCIYVSLRTEYGVQQVAVYVMLAYDVNGCKDVLGLWINETESKHAWMQISDELRARGVKDLGILSMDGVSGLEEGAKAVFPHATVQRCIVHLIRNSIRYIPRKQWSAFTKQLKLIYGAINVKQARQEFEKFKTDWQAYPGAVSVRGKQFLTLRKTISHTSSSSITMAVPCARSCTRPMPSSVNSSFPQGDQERRFPQRMQSSRFSTYASKSSIKNGRVVTSQTGRWSGTSCSWTTGCLSLCSNTMLLIESIYTKLLTHPCFENR